MTRAELKTIVDTKYPAAEIGVASGIFASEIFSWGVPLLYLVDHWQNTNEFPGDSPNEQQWHDKNFNEVTERFGKNLFSGKVVILKGLSTEMAESVPDGSLGFIYLDACHTFDAVVADILAWYPKLKQYGIFAGHDVRNPDWEVEKAVKAFCKGAKIEYHILLEEVESNSSFYFIKP